jgi:hypothetical protein
MFVQQKGSRSCENVELSKISSVDWIPGNGGGNGEDFPLWSIPLLPFVGAWEGVTQSHYVYAAFIGTWRPIETATEGKFSRLGFSENRNVWREDVLVKKGSYRVADGNLYITYAGSSAEEAARLQFVCDELMLEAPTGRHRLKFWFPSRQNPASAPIVGRWTEGDSRHGNVWEFRPDGSLELRITQNYLPGSFVRHQDAIRIRWAPSSGLPKEDWQLRLTGTHKSGEHLFITAVGSTVEYIRDNRRSDNSAPSSKRQ